MLSGIVRGLGSADRLSQKCEQISTIITEKQSAVIEENGEGWVGLLKPEA